jgi:hypothetical protein
MIIVSILFVIAWLGWEIKRAPLVDDDGNIVKKQNKS